MVNGVSARAAVASKSPIRILMKFFFIIPLVAFVHGCVPPVDFIAEEVRADWGCDERTGSAGMRKSNHFPAKFSRKNDSPDNKKVAYSRIFPRCANSRTTLHELIINQLIRPRSHRQVPAKRPIQSKDHEDDQPD